MNSNTPTPETDYAFEGDLSVGVNPEITTWQQAKEYARKLERERNMLQAKLTALGGLAVSGWDNKTVGEVDSLISAEKQLEYKDLLRSLFVDIPAERDQLRKVCDELAKAIQEGLNHGYGLRIGEEALDAYNQRLNRTDQMGQTSTP